MQDVLEHDSIGCLSTFGRHSNKTGVAHDAEWMVTGVDGQLESTEFFGGATVTGSLFFEVEQDETDLLLRYEELFGTDTAYLALQ